MSWMIRNGQPFVILFTKTDTLSKAERKNLESNYLKGMQAYIPHFMPGMIVTSAETREGKKEIEDLIKEMMPT